MNIRNYDTVHLPMLSLLGLLIIALSSCDPPPAIESKSTTSQTLTEWLDEQYELELLFSPIELTFLGRDEKKDELNDVTYEAYKQELEWKAASVRIMKTKFDRSKLNEMERLAYDLWEHDYNQMLEGEPFFYSGLVFDQMNGAHAFLPTFLINFHSVEDAEDINAYIKRIELIEPRVRDMLEIAKEASRRGVVAPYFAMDGVIKQSRALVKGLPFDPEATTRAAIWEDIETEIAKILSAGTIDEKMAASLSWRAKEALLDSFWPAYQQIITWAEEEQRKAPKIATGVMNQPDGEAYYTHRLRVQTTTDIDPETIHKTGLQEVKRLRAEMEALKVRVGFEGDLQMFFEEVRSGEWNYYPNTDEGRQAYIDDATLAIENLRAVLPNYFGLLPKADLIVKRVESFRERDGAAQHYYPGSPDGERPGTYYAHLSDMNAMPKNQLEVIAYHEGLPGHHMQISIAQELENVPKFQTQLGFTAFVEGWALYSEFLASEMEGTYTTEMQTFGRLSSEIWRAIRLVVDTGLHAKGWSEQDAIDFFIQNSPEPLESIRSEVRRYIVYPGQATTYKIGMLKILELRDKAKTTLGDRFDIKDFHDTVLGAGALPLNLLEKRVNRWLENAD